jgi:hypothetical protein
VTLRFDLSFDVKRSTLIKKLGQLQKDTVMTMQVGTLIGPTLT